jgi:hypothetical protein
VFGQFFRDVQTAGDSGQVEQPLRIGTKITGELRNGVVARIHGPDDFVQ